MTSESSDPPLTRRQAAGLALLSGVLGVVGAGIGVFGGAWVGSQQVEAQRLEGDENRAAERAAFLTGERRSAYASLLYSDQRLRNDEEGWVHAINEKKRIEANRQDARGAFIRFRKAYVEVQIVSSDGVLEAAESLYDAHVALLSSAQLATDTGVSGEFDQAVSDVWNASQKFLAAVREELAVDAPPPSVSSGS